MGLETHTQRARETQHTRGQLAQWSSSSSSSSAGVLSVAVARILISVVNTFVEADDDRIDLTSGGSDLHRLLLLLMLMLVVMMLLLVHRMSVARRRRTAGHDDDVVGTLRRRGGGHHHHRRGVHLCDGGCRGRRYGPPHGRIVERRRTRPRVQEDAVGLLTTARLTLPVARNTAAILRALHVPVSAVLLETALLSPQRTDDLRSECGLAVSVRARQTPRARAVVIEVAVVAAPGRGFHVYVNRPKSPSIRTSSSGDH